jgi:hypothetical protein
MALFIAVIIFLVLFVWNLEAFVKKHSRFPNAREILIISEEKDRQSFNFLLFVAVSLFVTALYFIFDIGPLLYFQSISFGSYLNTAFFASFIFSYCVRFSIYIESGGLVSPSEQYLFKLWRIKPKDVQAKGKKYKLLIANVAVSILLVSVFIRLIT